MRIACELADDPNGVYVYSATPAFPNASYQASNYWVDLLFIAGQ